MVGAVHCWYCDGELGDGCPVCGVPLAPPVAGSAAPLEGPAVGIAELPRGQQAVADDSLEAWSLSLLQESESFLRQGEAELALKVVSVCLTELMAHFGAQLPGPRQGGRPASVVQHGEREVLCLALAQRARCCLLLGRYSELADHCERSGRILDTFRQDEASLRRLLRQERSVLSTPLDEGGCSVLDEPLAALGRAAALAVRSRERVETGYMPEVVLKDLRASLGRLAQLRDPAFPGLALLRTDMHATRCQALLNAGRWKEAAEDAKLAIESDPGSKEAKYMLECAELEEW